MTLWLAHSSYLSVRSYITLHWRKSTLKDVISKKSTQNCTVNGGEQKKRGINMSMLLFTLPFSHENLLSAEQQFIELDFAFINYFIILSLVSHSILLHCIILPSSSTISAFSRQPLSLQNTFSFKQI